MRKLLLTRRDIDLHVTSRSDWIGSEIEWGMLSEYPKSRILFLAPHAGVRLYPFPEIGRTVLIGDRNTDLIAKSAAFFLKQAYLVSYVPRVEADFARPPERLGIGETFKLKSGHRIATHRNRAYRPLLEKWHERIRALSPKVLVSVHGMKSDTYDVALGCGAGCEYLGGERNLSVLLEFLEKKFPDLNIAANPKKYAGTREYNLKIHLGKYELGILVEFNLPGRENIEGSIASWMPTFLIELSGYLLKMCHS